MQTEVTQACQCLPPPTWRLEKKGGGGITNSMQTDNTGSPVPKFFCLSVSSAMAHMYSLCPLSSVCVCVCARVCVCVSI